MGLDSPCSPLSAICLACVYACDDAVVEYIIVGKRLVAFEAFTLKTISRDLILIDLSSVLSQRSGFNEYTSQDITTPTLFPLLSSLKVLFCTLPVLGRHM